MKRIENMFDVLLTLIVIVVVFYCLVTRPERRAASNRWESENRKMEIEEAVKSAMPEKPND